MALLEEVSFSSIDAHADTYGSISYLAPDRDGQLLCGAPVLAD
jgi:hypothetical protein